MLLKRALAAVVVGVLWVIVRGIEALDGHEYEGTGQYDAGDRT